MKNILNGVVFLALVALTATAYAQTWDETSNGGGDAGDFPVGGFQGSATGTAFDVITGELGFEDTDAYLITIENATWSADVFDGTNVNGDTIDTRTWLFDINGNFLMFNEDLPQPGAGILNSFISDTASFPGIGGLLDNPINPSVGDQVIMVINSFDDNARDTNGNLLINLVLSGFPFQSLLGYNPDFTNGIFQEWSYDNLTPEPGTYSIRLTGASFREMVLGEEVPASELDVFRGNVLSGGLAETTMSDDQRLIMNPGFTINSTEAPVWLIFDANLSTDTPTSLSLQYEAQAGTPGLTGTLESWNFTNGVYDILDETDPVFNNDSVVTANALVADHVEPGTAAVRTRLGWRQTGFTINFPWEIQVDQLIWLQQ